MPKETSWQQYRRVLLKAELRGNEPVAFFGGGTSNPFSGSAKAWLKQGKAGRTFDAVVAIVEVLLFVGIVIGLPVGLGAQLANLPRFAWLALTGLAFVELLLLLSAWYLLSSLRWMIRNWNKGKK